MIWFFNNALLGFGILLIDDDMEFRLQVFLESYYIVWKVVEVTSFSSVWMYTYE